MTLLEAAIIHVGRGLPVLPVLIKHTGGDGHGAWSKVPLNTSPEAGKGGARGASLDLDTVRAWWGRNPAASIGIACGWALEGGGYLLVIDDDGALKEAEAALGPLPPSVRVETPSGGWHVYLRTPAPLGNGKGKLKAWQALDVRGLGGFVVGPPSVRPDGACWRGKIDVARIAWLPDAWLAGIAPAAEPERPAYTPPPRSADGYTRERGYAEGALRKACQRVAAASEGTRHAAARNEAITLAGWLWTGLDRGVVERELCAAAVVAGKPDGERRTVMDGLAYGEARPRPVPEPSQPEARPPRTHAPPPRQAAPECQRAPDSGGGTAVLDRLAEARAMCARSLSALYADQTTRDERQAIGRELAGSVDLLAELPRAEWVTWCAAAEQAGGFAAAVKSLKSAVKAHQDDAAHAAKAARKAKPEPTEQRDHALDRCTDLGNAKRFVRHVGRDYRWCPTTAHGGWLHWSGARWEPDAAKASARAAKSLSRVIRGEAPRAAQEARDSCRYGDPDDAAETAYAEWMTWADTSENAARLEAILSVTATEPEIIVKAEHLDADPWLFNAPNATLELRSGQVRENRREDLLMHVGGVPYDPTAACPRWAQFVHEIMGGDLEMVAYLQRIAGYCMVGVVREAAFFIFWGSGRNGKGTFVERIRKVLGTYAADTAPDTFVGRKSGGIPNDIAALVGKRMVTMSEIEEGAKLEESLVKRVTGKDPVTARFMRAEFFSFIPSFTPILSCNDKPVVKGMGPATWGRLHLVPFTRSWEGREDLGLADDLDKEAAGILNWCLDGLAAWRDHGLAVPEKAKLAGEAYRAEMDIVGRFLEECTAQSTIASCENADLYNAFTAWLAENGEFKRSHRWLTQQLKNRKYELVDGHRRTWRGLVIVRPDSR